MTAGARSATDPRRVVIVSGDFPPVPGGVSDYCGHLVAALSGRGHSVQVVTAYRGRQQGDPPTFVVDITRQGLDWGLRSVRRLAGLLADLAPDVLSLQYVPHMYGRAGVAPGISALARLMPLGPGCTFVCTLHELGSAFAPSPRDFARASVHRLQLRSLLRPNASLVVTNPWDEARLRRMRIRSPIWQIPVGSNVPSRPLTESRRRRLRDELGLGESVVIGDFSAFSWSKRPDLLLTALGLSGPSARLLLIGGVHSDPELRRSFLELAARARLADRVIEAGELDSAGVSRMLSIVDVYVHTGVHGASSRSTTLVAALAHGLPVVAFRGVETPAYFDSGSLELVPAGRDRELVDAVARLVTCPEQRALLALAAIGLHRKRLDWDRIAKMFMEIAA